MASELQHQFDFDEALKFGLLPLRFQEQNPSAFLQAYISLYLEKEIRSEGLIRRLEPFARFLQTLSFSHGSVLNIANVAQECAVSRTTVSQWISIIEDLLICYQIPIFSQRAQRQLSSHPKFYFFDAGVYRALRPQSLKDPSTELEGPALEGVVLQHLIAWRDYTAEKHNIFFWRTRAGAEVDFILYGPFGLWAIEVKNSHTVRPSDLRALKAFQGDYPEAKTILLYRGQERLLKENVLCLPCEDFLRSLVPNKPLAL